MASSFLTGLAEGATPGVGKAAGKMKRKLSNRKDDSGGGPGGGGGGTDIDPEMHKGGKVRKSRSYKLQKGERVLSKKAARRYESKRGRKRG